jgi:hypothetical protein
LNQMQLAFQLYHEQYGCFPPAYVADAAGKPMHSWRVLILPFLDHARVYDEYDFAEPWNGPHNRTLADQIYSDIFHCASGPHAGRSPLTDYVVIVGPETPFPSDRSTTLADMRDGAENTILLAEIGNSDIHWMEPRDLRVDEMSFTINDPAQPSISSPHSRGPAIVFADSIRAYRIDRSMRPATLKALTTIAGGEPVFRERLHRRNGYGDCRTLAE